MTVGLKHCLRLLECTAITPGDAKILADYAISVLCFLPLPAIVQRKGFHGLESQFTRELCARLHLPDGLSGERAPLLTYSALGTLAGFEGWFNEKFQGYTVDKLRDVAHENPELEEIILDPNGSKLTAAHLSIFFRGLLGSTYPHFFLRSGSSDYGVDGTMFEVAAAATANTFCDMKHVLLEFELCHGEPQHIVRDVGPGPFAELEGILHLLELLSQITPIGPSPSFSVKIRDQLANVEEIITRRSPAIATIYHASYLFDFPMRYLAFRLHALDLKAAVKTLGKEFGDVSAKELHADPLKVNVHRDAVFVDGVQIFSKFAGNSIRLECSFIGEEGIGLGPTHEFFTLFSHELCRPNLVFRSDDPSAPFAHAQNGLFFSPIATEAAVEVLGCFIGKAILSECLVDIHFNPALFRFLRGQRVEISDVDPVLARSLDRLDVGSGCSFVYPGYEFELLPNGADIEVSMENVATFKLRIHDWTCGEALFKLRYAFIRGFEKVMPFSRLSILTEEEICLVLGGHRAPFNLSDLLDHVVISHGYTAESPCIMMLFEILAEFSPEHQRLLVQFITGYAHLPVGGLAALDPPLTIAKREFNDGVNPDHQLPSVMTCTNYFKVPSYSQKEIMRDRILTAITECPNGFELT
jgi:hypothetical protein